MIYTSRVPLRITNPYSISSSAGHMESRFHIRSPAVNTAHATHGAQDGYHGPAREREALPVKGALQFLGRIGMAEK